MVKLRDWVLRLHVYCYQQRLLSGAETTWHMVHMSKHPSLPSLSPINRLVTSKFLTRNRAWQTLSPKYTLVLHLTIITKLMACLCAIYLYKSRHKDLESIRICTYLLRYSSAFSCVLTSFQGTTWLSQTPHAYVFPPAGSWKVPWALLLPGCYSHTSEWDKRPSY